MVAVGVILYNLHRLQLFQTSLFSNLVFAFVGIVLQVSYVGDVTHIAHFISQMLEVTEENIESNGWTGVSQMWVTVHGGTADIHAYVWSVQWLEYFFSSGQRVVNRQLMFHIVRFLFPIEFFVVIVIPFFPR